MKAILNRLIDGSHLTEEETIEIMKDLMEGKLTPAQIGSFITALRIKGETVEEITGSARVMRNKCLKVDVGDMECIDTCGTGGDGANTYNVSTAAAFVAAAGGVPVAKHGNRSVSSRSGSADVLEALGARIDLEPEGVSECIRTVGMGFMFAPVFHKAMKYAIGPRKELGIRTIFNVLGPLTNPAGTKYQVLGVYSRELTHPIAKVLKNLGVKRALVVHGMDGLDELTVTSGTYVSELKENGEIIDYVIDPEEFGFKKSSLKDLEGGDARKNADIIRKLFEGVKGPARDMLLLNSGAALYISGRAGSIREGILMAEEIIDKGLAGEKLMEFCRATREVS